MATVSPTRRSVALTSPSVGATNTSVAATNGAVGLTKPSVGPTKASVGPDEAPVDPTKPSVKARSRPSGLGNYSSSGPISSPERTKNASPYSLRRSKARSRSSWVWPRVTFTRRRSSPYFTDG
jgi:hypothetical protein